MPELPEIEAARRLVETHLVGHSITGVTATESGGGPRHSQFDEKVLAGFASAAAAATALVGTTLLSTARHGKHAWWTVSGQRALVWHFGMSGSFCLLPGPGKPPIVASYMERVKPNVAVAWPPPFTKLELTFSNGARLAYTDPRRFGRINFEAANPPPQVSALGRDCLTAPLSTSELACLLAASARPIKAVLLDQTLFAGVGNYIADEVLYQARLHPETHAHALVGDEVARLHAALNSVVATAVGVDADYTRFPPTWLFHRRWGKGKEAAFTVDGHAIKFVTVGGRTSAVVPALQGRPRSGKAAVGASASAAAPQSSTAAAAAASAKQPRKAAAAVASAVAAGGASAARAVAGPSRKRAAPSALVSAAPSASVSVSATAAAVTSSLPPPPAKRRR